MSILGKALDRVKYALDGRHLKQTGKFVQQEAIKRAPEESGKLKSSIKYRIVEEDGDRTIEVYSDLPYAQFVEMGTGPRGLANHEGVSPDVPWNYRTTPWWIHESMVEPRLAEKYHWKAIHTKDGIFYLCHGSVAHPFLYPAIKENEQLVTDMMAKGYRKAMRMAKKR